MQRWQWVLGVVPGVVLCPALADDEVRLGEIEVVERSTDLVGISDAASEGVVGSKQLENRPLLRPGEVLETVPGLIATQHSGAGKANQFFLRGFNLDHGTDFATQVEGMPVNMPTHGHGQGYTDLNFLIPELIRDIHYRKGPYRAQDGDFAAAGSAAIRYWDDLGGGLLDVSGGSFDYRRALLGGSTQLGAGAVLAAVELYANDGPWRNPDDFEKSNAVLRYAVGDASQGGNLTLMAYDADWNATDQIPLRAVRDDRIDRFDTVDDTDGGSSSRYSLSGQWRTTYADGGTRVSAYVIDSDFQLFSNFTYFLDDPVNGDQFEQRDRRTTYGAHVDRYFDLQLGGKPSELTLGLDIRYNDIGKVALYATAQRQRLSTVREDSVGQGSAAPFAELGIQFTDRLRGRVGLRADTYRFRVNSDLPANSGKAGDTLLSPKLGVAWMLSGASELYASAGYGFHSNDARGSTIAIDPKTGDPADQVDPLVRAQGAELGWRVSPISGLQSALSLWILDIESELLFIGDAGATEASRPSRRDGIEWTNYYETGGLTLDLDVALSRARFRDSDPVGDRIPGTPNLVIAAGVHHQWRSGWEAGLRVRHFGERPLIEDNRQRSAATTLVNAELTRPLGAQWRIAVQVFNLLDADDNDIDYFYASRLPGEPAEGIEDNHFHPVERRSFRVGLRGRF